MISTIKVVQNDDSKACDNILQIVHRMSRNLVKLKFHSKDSKMLRTWYEEKDQRKTVKKRPVTVFCKLAIFWARMGFSVNFIVRTPKCRYDDQQQNTFCRG